MTFLHTWFLAGLGAALVPLLLHVVQTRRLKRIPFSTLHFLRILHQQRSVRIKISQLLLLLCRMALAVAIVLAFAQPTFTSSVFAFLNPGPRLTVLYWDNPGATRAGPPEMRSAAASPGGRPATVLESARRVARSLLGGLGPRDTLVVVATCPQPEVVYRGLAGEFSVDRLPASGAGSADHARSLELVSEVCRNHPGSDPLLLIVSDFRKSSWVPELFGRLPAVRTRLLPVGLESYTNWSVHHPEVEPAAGVSGEALTLTVTVALSTFAKAEPVKLSLDVDGKPVAHKLVSPTAEPQRVQFSLGALGVGQHRVRVWLPPDHLDLDDEVQLPVRVLPHRRVLLVNGRKRAAASQDEGTFLRRVLGSPESPRKGLVCREVTSLSGQEDLADLALVVLANVKAFEPGAVERLDRFLRSGGAILMFLGDQTDPSVMNAGPMGWFDPYRLQKRVEGGGAWRPAEGALELLGPLADEGFFKPVVSERYFLLARTGAASAAAKSTAPVAGDETRVAAVLSDGTPALLVARRDRGWAWLVNASSVTESSDLPLHPVFPSLVTEATRLADSGAVRILQVGEKMLHPLGADQVKATVSIQAPDGSLITPRPVQSEGRIWVPVVAGQRVGVHQIDIRTSTGVQEIPFIVAPPAGESALVLHLPDELAKLAPRTAVEKPKSAREAVPSRSRPALTLIDVMVLGLALLTLAELVLVWDLERRMVPGDKDPATAAQGRRAEG